MATLGEMAYNCPGKPSGNQIGHDISGMIMVDRFQIVIGSPALACLILLCSLKAMEK